MECAFLIWIALPPQAALGLVLYRGGRDLSPRLWGGYFLV
jgi:hypothetical protein